DSVGEPDFALWSAGASVVRELTSRTYTLDVPLWARLWRTPEISPRPPELALTPELQAGCCWPMKGQRGSLGIKLAQEIIPRAITIDHVPRQLAYRNDTAPRLIDVWGPLPSFVLLGQIVYDIHGRNPVQTFSLFSDANALKLVVDTLLLVFKENWGYDAYTCIYRVRVHG
ncbi:UNC-like C-terminal-domain-containing protein, partial [Cerioporus squamosus]